MTYIDSLPENGGDEYDVSYEITRKDGEMIESGDLSILTNDNYIVEKIIGEATEMYNGYPNALIRCFGEC